MVFAKSNLGVVYRIGALLSAGLVLVAGARVVAAAGNVYKDIGECKPHSVEGEVRRVLVELIGANPKSAIVSVDYSWQCVESDRPCSVWGDAANLDGQYAVSSRGRLFFLSSVQQLVKLAEVDYADGSGAIRWRIWYDVKSTDLELEGVKFERRLDAKMTRFANGWKSFEHTYQGPPEPVVWP